MRPGVNFQAHFQNFRRRVKNFGAQLQIPGALNPKRIVALQKERLRLRVAIWAYSSSIEHNENTMQESEYFTQELSLDINYSSRFVQYPHYPIACCLPHISMVAHNCHGKSINPTAKRKRLTAQIITPLCGKMKKTRGKKKNLTAKRKRLKAKRKPHGKKKKDSRQNFFDSERAF